VVPVVSQVVKVMVVAVEAVVIDERLIVKIPFPVVVQPIASVLPQVPQMSHDHPFQ